MITKEELLQPLNPQQKEAVEINSGSLLVFAGAGSGKTRVITSKIAYAISELGISPHNILAVTFTNRACREMSERVENFVGYELASQTVIKTFHSFGVMLLRRYASEVGLTPSFSIYDDSQSLSLLKQIYPSVESAEITELNKNITNLKEKGVINSSDPAFCAYQQRLREINAVDFGDLINLPTRLLTENSAIREQVQNRFKYILVDEYQDTNPAQLNLLKQLVGKDTFLCVVGDDDQSIYSFRSADVRTILDFGRDFAQTRKVVLSTNYRCNEKILNAAKDIIEKNDTRADKKLNSNIHGGNKPKLYYFNESRDEARFVANEIKNICSGVYSSCAVLFRTNSQAESFEDSFLMNNIPYRIVGDISFYNREEIQDCIAALRFMINQSDSVSFKRLCEKLLDGVGKVKIQKIVDAVTPEESNLLVIAWNMLEDKIITGVANTSLNDFIFSVNNAEGDIGEKPNYDIIKELITEVGILDYYREDSEKLGNVMSFISKFKNGAYSCGREGVQTFLENVSLEPNGDVDTVSQNKVTMITMHRTKGLEFESVFVTGLEDETFFNSKFCGTREEVEEERRLLYVAMTRAIKNLYLSSCSGRYQYHRFNPRKPLRFLKDFEQEHVQVIDRRSFNMSSNFGMSSNGYGNNRYNSYNNYNYYNTDDIDSWVPKKPNVTLVKRPSSEQKPKIDWKAGDRIRSETMGDGTITAFKKFGNREVLVVTFDSGKMGNFVVGMVDFIKL